MAEITAAPTSPLEAAIRGSTSIDPAGGRKPLEQLRVPSLEEREAEYRRLARNIEEDRRR